MDGLVDGTCLECQDVPIITCTNQNLLIAKVSNEQMVDCMRVLLTDVAGVWGTGIWEGELEDGFCPKPLSWEMRSVDGYLGPIGNTVKVVVLR